MSMDEQQAWSKSDWEDESEDFVNSNERQVSFLLFFVLLALSRARSRQPTNASPPPIGAASSTSGADSRSVF